MLVLARQRGESIVIGDDIEVTVVDIRGDKVRLGIKAPRTTTVHRKEIYDTIKEENRKTAHLQPGDIPTLTPPPPQHMRQVNEQATKPATPDPFLRAAIDQARKGLAEGGLPIGSVLVRNGQIIAAGHNRRVQHGDPMAHAEI